MTALLASVAIVTSSTAYCLTGTMADGSLTRARSVAHNGFPLGTRLSISPSPTGRRRFVVRDRIGWGTELDFWLPSCLWARSWGRRVVHVRVGWPRRVAEIERTRASLPRALLLHRQMRALP